MTIEASGPNAQQIEFWNGEAASAWTENQERMDTLLAPMSEVALRMLGAVRGQRVLDVGCGCGGTTLRLLDLGARATGIDISAPMLARARERAAERRDVEFLLADAAVYTFTPTFDAFFSRFGVMFFADPVAAFRNLRTALVVRGRIAFVCWQAARQNPWMAVPAAAARAHLPEPPPVDPRAPGPFAFAERDYVAGLLSSGGYCDTSIEPHETALVLGRTMDEALGFTARVGPLSRQLASVEPDVRNRALLAVRDALAPHSRNGEVRLGARCWLVTARSER